jgi:hypothetical protein
LEKATGCVFSVAVPSRIRLALVIFREISDRLTLRVILFEDAAP